MSIKYITKNKKSNLAYDLIIVCVSFKLNNVFVSINRFTKFIEFFILNKLLKYYSCGSDNLKNKNKTSLRAYNNIVKKVHLFLLESGIKKIHVVFKSSKRLKYVFLHIFLNSIYYSKIITILSIRLNLSIPFNGCKLKKRKFL